MVENLWQRQFKVFMKLPEGQVPGIVEIEPQTWEFF